MSRIRIELITFLHLFFCVLPVMGQGELALPEKADFHLYLLAGQSNMAGRGKISSQDKVAHPRVFVLTKANQWEPAVDPLHFDKSVAGVGLGKTFGEVIADANPNVVIGLIPCAVGGSPIESWSPGGFHAQTKSHPYDDCVKRMAVALKRGDLKGILWHQGESDANKEKARLYEKALDQLIKRFREQFRSPQVPFIVGQMGQFAERPWDQYRVQVDRVHQSLPSRVPGTAFVRSEGLGHRGDKVHFDSAGYRELGKRFAAAYLDLIAP